MSVVVVVIGVGVCTVTDVKVNLKGFMCACLAVLSTSLQQIVSIIQCFFSTILAIRNLFLFLWWFPFLHLIIDTLCIGVILG